MRPYLEASLQRRQAIRDGIERVLRTRPEVIAAFLFGSFVTERRFRDVDVGIVVDRNRVPEAAAPAFASALAAELEWETRVPVDLTVLNDAPIALRYHASRGDVIVCQDRERCSQFREQAWKEYMDFEPFLRASLRDLLPANIPHPAGPRAGLARPTTDATRPKESGRLKE